MDIMAFTPIATIKLEAIMSISRFTKLAAAGALAVMLGGPVLAHDDRGGWWRGWGTGHMMHGGGMHGHMMGRGWQDGMLERIDGRLAFLKTELRVTDSQKTAWDELATTIRENAETHDSMMRRMMKVMRGGEFFNKSLPERLTIRLTHMESRIEQIKGVQQSVEKLYAVLDDTQKKIADEIALPMMGMGMGRGHMMMH